MFQRIGAFAAVLTVVLASSASAAPVTLSKQNPGDTFNGGGKAVVSGISNRAGSFYAGGFRITDGTDNFVAWCLDIAHNLSLPSTYDVTTTPFTNANTVLLNSTQLSRIENLFEVNYKTLDISNTATGNIQSAGFQLALWELVYETNPELNAASGIWYATAPAAAIAAANGFLANLGNAITQNYALTFYQSTGSSQNLVRVDAIPLPAALPMLATGLGLLGYLARRRRGKNRAA